MCPYTQRLTGRSPTASPPDYTASTRRAGTRTTGDFSVQTPLRRPSSASTSAPPTAFWGATSVRALSRRRRQRQLHHLLVCLRGNSPSSYPHFVCGGRPWASVRQQGSFLLLSHRLARRRVPCEQAIFCEDQEDRFVPPRWTPPWTITSVLCRFCPVAISQDLLRPPTPPSQ
jgi:hypothetical protein